MRKDERRRLIFRQGLAALLLAILVAFLAIAGKADPNRRRRRLSGGGSIPVKAAQFSLANATALSVADNAALSMGAGVHPTFVMWVYPTNTTTARILSKSQGTAATIEYEATWNVSTLSLRVSNGTTIVVTPVSAALPLNAWTFMVVTYDGSNLGISINNGAFSNTALSADIQDSTNAVAIGSNSLLGTQFTGSMNEVGIVKSVLSAGEITELWNAGKGKRFSQLSAALAAKFVAYWDLDDAGGSGATWLDKAGTNHMTAGAGAAAPLSVVLRR